MTLVLDGSNYLHRALHNPDINNLTDSTGSPTGGAYVVIKMILSALKSKRYREPCVVMWDNGIPLFRRELFSEYKYWKKPTAEDGIDTSKYYSELNKDPVELTVEDKSFLEQYRFCRDLLNIKILPKLGIPSITVTNCEADDIISAWCKLCRGDRNIIITSDRDMKQLVDDNTDWYDVMRDHYVDTETLIKEDGLVPENYRKHFTLTKAINGDSSDNVPGIEGIGSKSALKLAEQLTKGVNYKDVERPPRCKSTGFDNFLNSEDQVVRNYKLVDLDYPYKFKLPLYKKILTQLSQLSTTEPDTYSALDVLRTYSMNSLLSSVEYITQAQYELDYFNIVKQYIIPELKLLK